MTGKHGSRPTRKLCVVGILTFLFLWLDTAPTIPAMSISVPDPPDLEEVAMMEEMADWLVGPAAHGRHLDTMVRDNLADLIREKPRSFELFRRNLDDGAEREFLRGLPYGDVIQQVADDNRLDGLLLAALVEVESSFLPDAVSPVGAVGLTQVMPSTAQWLGTAGDLTDPDSNLEVGARYLSQLLDRFDGNLELALAAYNAGPAAVVKYGGMPPYRETRRYVSRVLTLYADHNREVWKTSGGVEQLASLD